MTTKEEKPEMCRADTNSGGAWHQTRCTFRAREEGLCGIHIKQLRKRQALGMEEPYGWLPATDSAR